MSSKPTLHLIHGIPGSGKTTFAQKLEQEHRAVRFSPDEWMVMLHGTNPPESLFRVQHERIMALIWEHTGRVLRAGCDVVFDGGFWTRPSRDDARQRAKDLNVPCLLYAVRCSVDEARKRVSARTKAMPPGTLEITSPTFDFLLGKLEPLSGDEEHVVVESGEVKSCS
jgi:hypothetical protein